MVAFEEEEMGWLEMRAGQLEAAEDHFRRALELEPTRSDSLIGLGVVYLAWGEVEDAEELFHLALVRAEERLPQKRGSQAGTDPKVRPYLRALYHLAVTAIRRSLWEEAEVFLRQMLAWDPDGMEGEAFPLLGEAYHRRGRLEEAAYYYECALERDLWSWYSLGAVYLAVGKEAAAEPLLRHALQKAPELGRWIMYFPKVVPLPGGTIADDAFRQSVSYLLDHIDLWPESSRLALRSMAERWVAKL